jgi:hypothetical protein
MAGRHLVISCQNFRSNWKRYETGFLRTEIGDTCSSEMPSRAEAKEEPSPVFMLQLGVKAWFRLGIHLKLLARLYKL